MRIGVVAPAAVPYTRGGYERLWTGFVNHVNEQTPHAAELIKLPTPETTLVEVIEGYRRFSGLDVSGFDIVFTGKYPSWILSHPNHHVYMAHPLRGLYDTYPDHFPTSVDGPELADLVTRLDRVTADRAWLPELFAIADEAVGRLGGDHPALGHPGPFGRRLVHAFDRIALAPGAVRRHTAIAATVAHRPDYFPPAADIEVIHPPSDLPLRRHTEPGTYLFTASRLDRPKRLDLLVEAHRRSGVDVPLLIAGGGPEAERLAEMTADDPNIRLLGFVADEELPDLYGGAIAVPFIPLDEDYGLITLEALQSGTPVITTNDSGGPTELVRHGATGWIVEPDAAALGAAIAEACADPGDARRRGLAGADDQRHVDWDNVTRRLLRASGAGTIRRSHARTHQATRGRPRLLELNTFAAHNPQGGGALRAFHLGRGLADRFDVHLLSLTEAHHPAWTETSRPGFTETAVPRSAQHMAFEHRRGSEVGQPMGDLLGGLGIHLTPTYLRRLRALGRQSDVLVLSHPYLQPAVELAGLDLPVVYDAHNVEVRLKDDMYPRSVAGDAAIADVRRVEAAAIERASLVSLCSTEDEAMMRSVYGDLPPTIVVPNGTDVDAIPLTVGEDRIARRRRWLEAAGRSADHRLALFLASWHQPNLDAAEVLHEIAADRPEIVFVMVGSHCDYFAGRRLPPNVVQMGRIGDTTKRVLLQCADVGVNPMATGSGTNLKLVEYLAAGMVALSTPIGGRGLPGDGGGAHIVELDEFGDGLNDVLRVDHDHPERIATARAARELVDAEFSWPALARRFAATIDEQLGLA